MIWRHRKDGGRLPVAVMMVAMMTPSAAPMILTYSRVNRRHHGQRSPFLATGVFLAGYLVVWTGFSAFATLSQWALHRAALLSPMMVSDSPCWAGCCWLLMALLFVAGVMNLLWVAAIAAYVLVEKIVPESYWVGRAVGLCVILVGVCMVSGTFL